jgi:hypothetical protein
MSCCSRCDASDIRLVAAHWDDTKAYCSACCVGLDRAGRIPTATSPATPALHRNDEAVANLLDIFTGIEVVDTVATRQDHDEHGGS